MKSVDRAFVQELLADETLSYKEIARRADCSDWSVRSIDRKRNGGPPMKASRARHDCAESTPEEPSRPLTGADKAIAWSVIGLIVVGVFALSRYARRDDLLPYYPWEGPMT